MEIDQLVAFAAVDLLLVLTPGADWAYAITAGLRRERLAAAVGGLVAGYGLHAALVVVGVGALLARDADALAALTLLGAAYLMWLGLVVLRDPATPAADPGAPTRSPAATAARGVAVSGLNPKGLLLFFAVLPQFADPRAGWPLPVQLALFAGVHLALCALVYLAVAAAARRLLAARRRAARAVVRVSGAAMILVAAVLAAGHV